MDWEAEGLLDDCEGEDARAARSALLDRLHADGVPVEELRAAAAEQRLALLPVERLLSSEARYTAREIAAKSGLDLDWFQTQRRVLGLAVPDPDERVYGVSDLESARLGCRYRHAGCPSRRRWRRSACSATAWPATPNRSARWWARRSCRAAPTRRSSPPGSRP